MNAHKSHKRQERKNKYSFIHIFLVFAKKIGFNNMSLARVEEPYVNLIKFENLI